MTKTKHKSLPTPYFSEARDFALAESREIFLYGMVAPESVFPIVRLMSYMKTQSKDPITIHLNSYGGSVYDGLALFDQINLVRNSGVPVDIVTYGVCMSVAMYVLQAARNRLTTPNTSFLLHEGTSTFQGTSSQRADVQKEFDRTARNMDKILSDRSGLSIRKVKNLSKRKDYFFGAEEALRLGFVDSIVS